MSIVCFVIVLFCFVSCIVCIVMLLFHRFLASGPNITISITLLYRIHEFIYRDITFLSMVLFQLSLGRRRRFGSTSTRWRSTSNSNVLRIAFFRHPLLKSHGCLGRSAQQACMLWFCILPSTCYHLKLLCSQECAQEEPSLPGDSLSVVPSQPATVADAPSLQRDVDPKLLVSSKGKGPTARRQYPTQKNPTIKVCVLKILLVHVLGESMLPLCAHLHSVQKTSASQPPPLEYEHAGGKRNRSASHTVATSTRPPRRQCSQPPPGKK